MLKFLTTQPVKEHVTELICSVGTILIAKQTEKLILITMEYYTIKTTSIETSFVPGIISRKRYNKKCEGISKV